MPNLDNSLILEYANKGNATNKVNMISDQCSQTV